MKRLLLLLCLAASNLSQAAAVSPQTATAVNDGLPNGYPPFLLIERMPFGSGTPALGNTNGYETALPVMGGLYHVPGYLPYGVEAQAVAPRVIRVPCAKATLAGRTVWACSGYTVTPNLGRGENILLSPEFKQ